MNADIYMCIYHKSWFGRLWGDMRRLWVLEITAKEHETEKREYATKEEAQNAQDELMFRYGIC